jgi:hypothetical protein
VFREVRNHVTVTVTVTEQWSGGQLLPQPLTLLLEALGCHPKAFLLLACIWQQQPGGSSQQSQSQYSSQQAHPQVLEELNMAYHFAFSILRYSSYDSSGPTDSAPLLQRLSCCHDKGQHQPQHTKQHLLLATLLMREAVRGVARGMFQAGTPRDAASKSRPDRLGKCALTAASTAAGCVDTWLCWARFERQQQQDAQQQDPAAVLDAATASSQPWGLGGESSSAVLLEVLQGHCRLLQEGARELQAVTNSWVATCSSSYSDNSSSNPDVEVWPGGEVSAVDSSVNNILKDVSGLLRALLATAAVDSGVLQQAAPQLFGLAGTMEQLVRLRCACHSNRLAFNIDCNVPLLLQLLLGSQDLLAYADLRQDHHDVNKQKQQLSRACDDVRMCGMLPYLALHAPLGGQRQRQLLGLLFSSLKLFSAYPAGLYAFSWAAEVQGHWLPAACDTLWAACAGGRLLLVTGGPGGWDVLTGTPGCSQAAGGSSSGSAGKDQQQHQGQDSTSQGATGGQGSSCHSCGLGAEGTAALLPWVVLQGRAVQLWVALFRACVQLPAVEGSKLAAKGSKLQEPHRQPYSRVGSAKALNMLAAVFEEAVAPSTQLMAVVLTGEAYPTRHSLVEPVLHWQLQRSGRALLVPALREGIWFAHILYGVPWFLLPYGSPAPVNWLHQQLAKRQEQLRGNCSAHGLDMRRMEAASESAASTVLQAQLTVMATRDGLKQLGDSEDTQHRLRQSDMRRYLKSWEVGDAAALKGVLAMLSGGEHSAAGVAVAAWLCSPSIAGDLLAQLQEFSSQLSTLPIHEACNNPACRVTAGSREQGLVSGKACVCAGCRMGHYCSRACQREHWPLHQLQCGAAVAKCQQ